MKAIDPELYNIYKHIFLGHKLHLDKISSNILFLHVNRIIKYAVGFKLSKMGMTYYYLYERN